MDKQSEEELAFSLANLFGFAILGFIIGVIFTSMSNCASWRLPDRSHPHCSVPWESRIVCLDNSVCTTDHVCARSGQAVGRCTYIDCCDPWRSGPKLLGTDWCTHTEVE